MRQSVKERDLQLQKRECETAQQADELALLRKSLSNSKEGVAKLEATNSKQNFELVRSTPAIECWGLPRNGALASGL